MGGIADNTLERLRQLLRLVPGSKLDASFAEREGASAIGVGDDGQSAGDARDDAAAPRKQGAANG